FGAPILGDRVQHILPTRVDSLTMSRLDEADRAMAKRYARAARDFFQLDFEMVHRRIRHKHRTAQLQENRRLDYLQVSPEVADAVPAVAEPTSARPLLQNHLQRFAFRSAEALAKPVEHAAEDVADCCLDLDVLIDIERHLFKFH